MTVVNLDRSNQEKISSKLVKFNELASMNAFLPVINVVNSGRSNQMNQTNPTRQTE